MKLRTRCITLSLFGAASLCSIKAQPIIKNSDTLAFLGDSITQYGAAYPAGYVKLVIRGLEVNGITVKPVFAGISGHQSNDMRARLEKDVLSTKPTFMTLSCGVNDVWQGPNGVPLDKYKENITAIIDKTQAAGVKPVILTSTMISENQNEALNQKLLTYNEFLRALAKERNLPLADLNQQMQEAVKAAKAAGAPRWNKDYYLTCDSVHMGPQGNQMMAEGVLRALGLDEKQIAKAKAAWLEIPDAIEIEFRKKIPLKDYNKLAEKAAKENLSFVEYLDKEFQKTVDERLGK